MLRATGAVRRCGTRNCGSCCTIRVPRQEHAQADSLGPSTLPFNRVLCMEGAWASAVAAEVDDPHRARSSPLPGHADGTSAPEVKIREMRTGSRIAPKVQNHTLHVGSFHHPGQRPAVSCRQSKRVRDCGRGRRRTDQGLCYTEAHPQAGSPAPTIRTRG
ncbi:hypothetical protein BV20DRAFT_168571 [Pilatotrama ljubarskyi]|nr:hypothetical protein BV20DRAFT_168571 [Pilatotrama ljubarskyi]